MIHSHEREYVLSVQALLKQYPRENDYFKLAKMEPHPVKIASFLLLINPSESRVVTELPWIVIRCGARLLTHRTKSPWPWNEIRSNVFETEYMTIFLLSVLYLSTFTTMFYCNCWGMYQFVRSIYQENPSCILIYVFLSSPTATSNFAHCLKANMT